MRFTPLMLRGLLADVDGKGPAVVAMILVALISVMPLLALAAPASANGGIADAERLPEPGLAPGVGDAIPELSVHDDMTIELLPSACSAGPQILLGEIAVLHVEDEALREELHSVGVGSVPLPGSSRKVNLGQVQVRMRARKIDPAKFVFAGASEVMVEAAARRIAAQDLEAAAINAVCASTGHALSPSNFRVARTDAPQGLLVPPGEVRLEAQVAPTGADMAFVRVRVRAMVDGMEARSVLVWLEITAPPVVAQLGAVTLVVEAGDVRISVPAVALQDGRPGQRIRVRNAVTGIVVQARVLDSQTVRAHAGDMEGSP
ncbi:MAG: flagella basal body P-ring formation protein FlgA [Firmicutes bacterium]|nr:flagella basal body P-ring formation protein FlgA [Bacillota bacterium]